MTRNPRGISCFPAPQSAHSRVQTSPDLERPRPKQVEQQPPSAVELGYVARPALCGNDCDPVIPLPDQEFMRVLRQAWGTSIGLPATRWMLELGAVLLRTETELILKSRRVVPQRLLEAGFKFNFADWPDTASDLVNRWRSNHARA